MAFLTETVRAFTSALALRGSFESITAAGAIALTAKSAQFLRIDPDGSARALTLPTDGLEPGRFCVVINVGTAAEDITVNSTLAVVTPGDMAVFYVADNLTWSLWGLAASGVWS